MPSHIIYVRRNGRCCWCGNSGTVLLEADFLGRRAIGSDLSPYAHLIARAKFSRCPLDEHLAYLRSLSDVINDITEPVEWIPDWVQAYFHEETLQEIVFLVKNFRGDAQDFLLACLLGILHGNRPGYLSVYTGCIIPMKPRPPDHPQFRPDKDAPEYRAVIPRLAAKVMRMYSDPVPNHTQCRILNEDARELCSLQDGSVDVVISSPPYFNTLDYANQNRLRLFFLGMNRRNQKVLGRTLIQDQQTYPAEMEKVGRRLKELLTPEGHLIFVLGDVVRSTTTINTADVVGKRYEKLGFEMVGEVADEIPLNKIVSTSKRRKMDRVLVMRRV